VTPTQRHVLLSLAAGWTLKVHRTLDGDKQYLLHPLDDAPARDVSPGAVEALRSEGLVDSNKKFPAATYLLTDKGREAVVALGEDAGDLPLTAWGWGEETGD